MPNITRRALAGRAVAATMGTALLMSETTHADAATAANDTVLMKIKYGTVTIRLRPDLAPKAAERIRVLCGMHFYDNTPFHRVIAGFMAQGGDPTGTGTGGSSLPDLPAEFTNDANFLRGTMGMARASNPNSANSQFFIMFDPAPSLDGQYTIVGQVVQGMEFVDMIKKGSGPNGIVQDPDRVITMRLASDTAS